ncbi:MAG: hypothetical protein ACFFDN_50055, partial [Candidatus Hodarchaeota archaeon]
GNSILDEIEDLINKDAGISRLITIEFYFLILSINMVIFYAGLSFWFKSPFPTISLNIICSTFFILPIIWHKSFEFKYFLINLLLNMAFFILLIWRLEEQFNQLVLAISLTIVVEIFISIIFTYLTFFKIVPFLKEGYVTKIERISKIILFYFLLITVSGTIFSVTYYFSSISPNILTGTFVSLLWCTFWFFFIVTYANKSKIINEEQKITLYHFINICISLELALYIAFTFHLIYNLLVISFSAFFFYFGIFSFIIGIFFKNKKNLLLYSISINLGIYLVIFTSFSQNYDIVSSLCWSFLTCSLIYIPYLLILFKSKIITSQTNLFKHIFTAWMIFKINGAILIFINLISDLFYGILYPSLFLISLSFISLIFAKNCDLISGQLESIYLNLLRITIIDVSFLICGGIFNEIKNNFIPLMQNDFIPSIAAFLISYGFWNVILGFWSKKINKYYNFLTLSTGVCTLSAWIFNTINSDPILNISFTSLIGLSLLFIIETKYPSMVGLNCFLISIFICIILGWLLKSSIFFGFSLTSFIFFSSNLISLEILDKGSVGKRYNLKKFFKFDFIAIFVSIYLTIFSLFIINFGNIYLLHIIYALILSLIWSLFVTALCYFGILVFYYIFSKIIKIKMIISRNTFFKFLFINWFIISSTIGLLLGIYLFNDLYYAVLYSIFLFSILFLPNLTIAKEANLISKLKNYYLFFSLIIIIDVSFLITGWASLIVLKWNHVIDYIPLTAILIINIGFWTTILGFIFENIKKESHFFMMVVGICILIAWMLKSWVDVFLTFSITAIIGLILTLIIETTHLQRSGNLFVISLILSFVIGWISNSYILLRISFSFLTFFSFNWITLAILCKGDFRNQRILDIFMSINKIGSLF